MPNPRPRPHREYRIRPSFPPFRWIDPAALPKTGKECPKKRKAFDKKHFRPTGKQPEGRKFFLFCGDQLIGSIAWISYGVDW